MSRSLIRISPSVGSKSRVNSFINVDFPVIR